MEWSELAKTIEDETNKSNNIIKAMCWGCTVDSPSQRDHDICVMMSNDEKLNLLKDIIFDNIKNQIESTIKEIIINKLKE